MTTHMKKLRIAQIAPPFIPVPPKGYGGTEAVVSAITEELVARGHDVTLFASGDSQTSAKLVSIFGESLNPERTQELYSPLAYKLFWMHGLPYLLHTARAFDNTGDFDIIHDHTHYLSAFFAQHTKTPMVSTYHGSLQWASQSPIERMILERYKNNNWIAISDAQKRFSGVPLSFSAVIHHGISADRFPFSDTSTGSYAWLGRITQQKGIQDAIEAAKALHKSLTVSGIVNARDQQFYTDTIEPEFGANGITYAGPSDHTQKTDILKTARALLYPVLWEEPFGLVMVESMACGTPVIAYARGAAPKIVQDGVTGFLVNSSAEDIRGDFITKKTGVDGLKEAMHHIDSMPPEAYTTMRTACRRHVEQHFTVGRMVDQYEQV